MIFASGRSPSHHLSQSKFWSWLSSSFCSSIFAASSMPSILYMTSHHHLIPSCHHHVCFFFLPFWATWFILFLIFRFTIIILVLVLVFLTRRIDGTLGRVFAWHLLLFSKRLSSTRRSKLWYQLKESTLGLEVGWIGLFKNFLKNLAETRQVWMIRCWFGWSEKGKEYCMKYKIYIAFDDSLWIQCSQIK